ncbi:hypothetical protein ABPG75_010800 [Micractinium tetrahymenae]
MRGSAGLLLLVAAASVLALPLAAAAVHRSLAAQPPLKYAVLLSEGPDKSGTAPWGSYHVSIAGYLPCQSYYGAGACTTPPAGVSCSPSTAAMATAAGKAWAIANAVRCGQLRADKHGQVCAWHPHVTPSRLLPLAHLSPGPRLQELCKRGFSDLKGPQYANYTWHMTLGTTSRAVAQQRMDKVAAVGTPLKLWLVPCHVDDSCSTQAMGCPCGQGWIEITPQ